MAEGQRSKFMTVYVAEIKGRGILGHQLGKGDMYIWRVNADAERILHL